MAHPAAGQGDGGGGGGWRRPLGRGSSVVPGHIGEICTGKVNAESNRSATAIRRSGADAVRRGVAGRGGARRDVAGWGSKRERWSRETMWMEEEWAGFRAARVSVVHGADPPPPLPLCVHHCERRGGAAAAACRVGSRSWLHARLSSGTAHCHGAPGPGQHAASSNEA